MLEKIKESADLLLAGFLGSVVGLYFYPEFKTKGQILRFVLSGSIISYYGGRFIIAYYHLESDALSSFFGFLIGIFGASLVQAGKRAVDSLDLLEILKARFPFLRGKNE